jgi:hypothetical protein
MIDLTKSMKRTANAGGGGASAEDFEITAKVPLRRLTAIARRKDQCMFVVAQMPVQNLAQLNAHWHEAMLVSLSFDPKHQVFQIHVRTHQAKQLAYPQAGIQGRKGRGVRPRFITPDGLPVHYPRNLLRSKGD